MPARSYRPLRGMLVNEAVYIEGSFAPDTANPPTTVRGKGFTVARSGAGTFVVTLDQVYPELVSGVATLQLNAADDKYAQLGAVDLANRTVVIRVWDASGAAATDVAANANNRINFSLCLKTSSTP